jgi:hypothetical protein
MDGLAIIASSLDHWSETYRVAVARATARKGKPAMSVRFMMPDIFCAASTALRRNNTLLTKQIQRGAAWTTQFKSI